MFPFKRKRLQIENEIGRGTYGTVFPYQKDPTDLRWVVKKIRTEDVDKLLKSLPEIVLGFSCDHPSIVPIKGYFIDKDSNPGVFDIYLKLPRMHRTLLQDFKRRKHNPYSQQEITRHFYSLVCGLEYLYNKNISHGDIKHDNLLFDKEGNGDLKIGDIGLAKHVEKDDEQQTLTGHEGAYHYSAPETLGEKRKTLKKAALVKADIWSLGVVIMELCTSLLGLINSLQPQEKIKENVEKSLKLLDGEYHHSLISLIEKMLSLNSEERPTLRIIKDELEKNFAENLDQNLLNMNKSP